MEKQRIDAAKEAVSAEISALDTHLASLTISATELDELVSFTAAIKEKLGELTFATKRRIVELLNVRVILRYEDGQQYADVTCTLTLQREVVPVVSSSRQGGGPSADDSTVSTRFLLVPLQQLFALP